MLSTVLTDVVKKGFGGSGKDMREADRIEGVDQNTLYDNIVKVSEVM